MTQFKEYLLNEDKTYLGSRVGDVLTAIQDLQDDMENLGQRHINKLAEDIVNQIRKILHSQWAAKNKPFLKDLQKIGVAIMKTIEDRGDLREIIPAATQELQRLSGKMGVKVNNMKAPEQDAGENITQDDFQLTADGPPPKQQQPQQPPAVTQVPQFP